MIKPTDTIKRFFSPADIARMRAVSSLQFSPHANFAVCVITELNETSWQDNIVVINLATNEQQKIAAGSSPKWSPDGSQIAYLGDNDGGAGIFVYSLTNGLHEFVAAVYESDYFIDHYASKDFCWSPDGKAIAYISAITFIERSETAVSREFSNLLYKSKGGRGRNVYSDQRTSHIWLVTVADKMTRLVSDTIYNEHSITFSPDKQKICFVSNTSGQPDRNQWSNLFSIDTQSRNINPISTGRGSVFLPGWSPDGKFIAYLAITSEISTNDSPAEDTQLYIQSCAGGLPVCLTRSLDRRVEQISWAPSSATIYFTAGNAGRTILYSVSIGSGEINEIISGDGKVTEYSVSANGKKIIYVYTDTTNPGDVFIYDIETSFTIQVTHLHTVLLNDCLLQSVNAFWYASFDSAKIQGWIMKPAGFTATMKYPLILVIHGGPHNMFGYEFEDRMQALSAAGYGVLFINPRGSSGYGQQFSNGTLRAWGEGDYEDLMLGVDEAIRQNSWVDATRLGVTGQSYGGYMTNRIITKTKRFSAAVADGSICNLISFAGTSLYHSLMESEYQSPVADNYDALWKNSPLREVKNVSTPTLFLHGETDNEVPVSQAEEMYTALKKMNVITSFVQYAREGHGWRPDLMPYTKIDLLTRIIDWFDRYVKNKTND